MHTNYVLQLKFDDIDNAMEELIRENRSLLNELEKKDSVNNEAVNLTVGTNNF